MSDISKIKVSGVEYDIKDIQAREDLGNLGTRVTELEQHGGGGGASSSDVFIIHATPDETFTNAQLDKTTEQISEAYQSGKYCLVCANGIFMQVISVEVNDRGTLVECCGFGFPNFQGRIYGSVLATSDGVTWAIRNKSKVLLYNVCFDRPQITGIGGRMYTISVDADGNLIATLAT